MELLQKSSLHILMTHTQSAFGCLSRLLNHSSSRLFSAFHFHLFPCLFYRRNNNLHECRKIRLYLKEIIITQYLKLIWCVHGAQIFLQSFTLFELSSQVLVNFFQPLNFLLLIFVVVIIQPIYVENITRRWDH